MTTQAECNGKHDYIEGTGGKARCSRCGCGEPGSFDADVFVDAWLSSRTIREVSERTGLSDGTVVCYGSMLRRIGIDLPRMNRSAPIDIKRLQEKVKASRKRGGR